VEKEREGWRSRGGMGNLIVFWECFTVERGTGEGIVGLLLGERERGGKKKRKGKKEAL
jgi:hypothetical protein